MRRLNNEIMKNSLAGKNEKYSRFRLVLLVFLFVNLFQGGAWPSFFVSRFVLAESGAVINEICWMGSLDNANAEWIELHNSGSADIRLDGWVLEAEDGSPSIKLIGNLPAKSFFLLERTNDDSVANVKADLIYVGVMENAGEKLILKDVSGASVDTVAVEAGWLAGDNDSKETMSRLSSGAWVNSVTVGGTPGRQNDVEVQTSTPVGTSSEVSSETADSGATENKNPGNSAAVAVSDNQNIIINEFVSSPESGATEWVELFNTGKTPVDLNDWHIKDGSESKTNLSGIINPSAYLIIDKISGKLNNTGDAISLYDGVDRLIDVVAYGKGALAIPTKGESLARINEKKFGRAAVWQTTKNITKGAENILSSKDEKAVAETISKEVENKQLATASSSVAHYSEDIYLNEIYPNPDKDRFEDEWVELCNRGVETVSLTSWQLDDEVKGSRAHVIADVSLAPSTCSTIWQEQSGVILNNDGDQVRLLWPDGRVTDEVVYGKAPRGQSFARQISGGWSWTSEPTLGTANSFSLSNEIAVAKVAASKAIANDSSSGSKAKAKANNAKTAVSKSEKNSTTKGQMRVTGKVVSLPGALGSQFFYISGSTVKQVYSYKKLFPALQLGDEVEVIGEISKASAVSRIKTKSKENIKVIKHGTPVQPLIVGNEEIDEVPVGTLVEVKGILTEKKSNTLFLDDQSAEVKIYFKKNGASFADLKKDDYLTIRGVLESSSSGARVVPRGADDVIKNSVTANDFSGEVQGAFAETADQWTLDGQKKTSKKIYYIPGALVVLLGLWQGGRILMRRREE